MIILFLFFFNSNLFAQKPAFQIVSYNVQNLFDSNHDEGHEDYEFLPISHPLKIKGCNRQAYAKRAKCKKLNWSEESITLKIAQIKKAIGRPDALAILEIENQVVAKKLASELGFSNYVVSDVHDGRGITTAFFFRHGKIVRKREIPIRKSRSILELKINISTNETITFFVNHWPSQGNSSYAREEVGKKLLKRVGELPNEQIVALGDFNLDGRYEANSFFDSKKLVDLSPLYEANIGTYFFIPEQKWSGFDRVLVSKNLMPKIKSFKILKKKALTKKFILAGKTEEIPFRFNYSTLDSQYVGFSDHFPVSVTLMLLPIDRKKF
jgi:Endonuclease/Exonuclease/phosphatase family